MKRNQKGFSNVLIVVVVVVVLTIVGLYFLNNKTTPPTYQRGTTQSDSSLTNASQELDATNIDSTLDPELNLNTTDSQTF